MDKNPDDGASEGQRQERIKETLGRYLDAVREIDLAMGYLAGRFKSAHLILNDAEAVMTAEERKQAEQLRNPFGPTLAAAHHGLGEYLQLGPAANHTEHRQPLAAFLLYWLDQFVMRPKLDTTNGNGKEN